MKQTCWFTVPQMVSPTTISISGGHCVTGRLARSCTSKIDQNVFDLPGGGQSLGLD